MSRSVLEVALYAIAVVWAACAVLCVVMVWQETRAGARAARARARRRMEDFNMQRHAQGRGLR